MDSTAANSTLVYLDPKFSQFIDFCSLKVSNWDTAPPITSQPSESVLQTVMVQTVTFKLANGKVSLGTATITVDPDLVVSPSKQTTIQSTHRWNITAVKKYYLTR